VLDAQGVTTAALQGRVIGFDSIGVEAATVLVTNTANGERWQTVSHSRGRYSLEQLSIGGPYLVEVRALGYRPARRDGVTLTLGQRLTLEFTLTPLAYELNGITVSASADPRINSGRTAPAYSVPESTAARLPVFQRDFLRLALLSPLVTRTPSGGLSIAGQPDRLNAVQIDGATNQDLLGSSGFGGIQVLGARTLSVEAIRELQVISAPFDVRYGNFAAGLINAVTKSGGNRWEGSVSGYYADQRLVGRDAFGHRVADFGNKEATLTLGGPLVRDRAAFFLTAGLQRSVTPETAPLLGRAPDSVVGVTTQEALRFGEILRDTYGVEPGGIGPNPSRVPALNLLGKVSLQLGVNSRLELSHAYSRSHLSLQVSRSDFDAYTLTSNAFALPVQSHATRLAWSTTFGGRYSNELTLARQEEGFHCEFAADFPAVRVATSGRPLVAGGACLAALVRARDIQHQNLLELTDNVTVSAGAHRLTFGTHDERLRLVDLPILDHFYGTTWTFGSLDDLAAGRVESYQAALRTPERASGPLSQPLVTQLGAYAQDQWNPAPTLTLTGGIRVDVPYVSRAPPRNDSLLDGPLGIDNTRTPSGHPLWAPRLGVNLDVTGRGTTYLRGGIGWFAGRPAYKWFVAVDAHSGLDELDLLCEGENAPAFTLDPARQPSSCAGGSQPQGGPINVFDPGFRFPRNLKLAFGADQRLPGGVVGTVDVLYTRAANQLDLVDRNLRPPDARAAGEGGRLLYGVAEDGSLGPPSRVDPRFGQVIAVGNARGDQAYSITGQLQKRFANGTALEASYTYGRSRDRLSSNADNTDFEVDQAALDGSLEDRRLATALWNVPHRVTLLATANLPMGFRGALFYEGLSGAPFTYVVVGDANGDGFPDNDIMYVPRDPSPGGDVELAVPDGTTGEFVPARVSEYDALANAISREGCLRAQRGRIMRRNSCRAPWSNHADARVSRLFSTFRGHTAELTLDIFNVLNLLDRDWGRVRGSDPRLLELVGYDRALGRGVYRRIDAGHTFVDEDASRWRMQLGARYTF
jgi:outer membrane receptor protein involved in Fe transport